MQQFRAERRHVLRRQHEGAARRRRGRQDAENMKAANAASIPGNEELDAVSLWVAWLQGKVAMIYSWPPTGRMSAGYSQSDKAISFIPQSSIAGKVGYAIVPGGHPEHAFGFNKALAGGFGESRRGVSLHAVGLLAARVAGALHAALRAARPVPDLALQVGPLRRTLPERARLSEEPQQLRQCRPARPDHAGRAGLPVVARPHVHVGVGGRRPDGGAQDRRGGVGRHDREPRRRNRRRRSTRSS